MLEYYTNEKTHIGLSSGFQYSSSDKIQEGMILFFWSLCDHFGGYIITSNPPSALVNLGNEAPVS